MLPHRAEQLANEAIRRPVGHADAACRTADPEQFLGGLILVRREHHAEGGQDHVEGVGLERQGLGIGRLESDRQAVRFCPRPAALQKCRNIVG